MKSDAVLHGNVPAWYELSFSGTTLLIHAHQSAADWVCRKLTSSFPRAQSFQGLLGLPLFIGAEEESWGFGPILTKTSVETGWIVWECPLPEIRDSDPESGLDRAFAVSATLKLLFDTLDLVEAATDHPKPQLLAINGLGLGKDNPRFASLGVSLSPEICRWLSGKVGSQLQEISQAMGSAYKHMLAPILFNEHSFQAEFSETGMLHLSCSGRTCGLDPSSSLSTGEGYELDTHNSDTPVQQLTLLVGVAALYEMARREGC